MNGSYKSYYYHFLIQGYVEDLWVSAALGLVLYVLALDSRLSDSRAGSRLASQGSF